MSMRINGASMGFPSAAPPAMPPCESFSSTELGRIRGFMNACYTRAAGVTQSRWAESELDTRYYIGDQTLFYAGAGNAQLYRKRAFVFNLIRPMVQMISGRQRQHRKSIICQPQDDTDSYGCSQLTKALMWSVNNTHGLETFSEAFQGALITGLDMLYVGMDYSADPVNGDPLPPPLQRLHDGPLLAETRSVGLPVDLVSKARERHTQRPWLATPTRCSTPRKQGGATAASTLSQSSSFPP